MKSHTTIAINATAPTTPPKIAPVGVFFDEGGEEDGLYRISSSHNQSPPVVLWSIDADHLGRRQAGKMARRIFPSSYLVLCMIRAVRYLAYTKTQ
jgi:hypothetical protein